MDGDLSAPFDVTEGVRQGCLASPLVFSLFMDRLEAFVESHMVEWTYHQRRSVTIAGLLIPLLLFADDIELVGRDAAMV